VIAVANKSEKQVDLEPIGYSTACRAESLPAQSQFFRPKLQSPFGASAERPPADLTRMIGLGIDNLITNRPQEALALIDRQANLSPLEMALRRLRTWMQK
jgi:hypothetical protein